MGTATGGDQGGAIGRALVTISLMSQDLTRLAAQLLGQRSTGNRDVEVMQHVVSRPGITPSEVGRATGMSRSSTSRTIGNLARDGLLDRRPNPGDHRSTLLFPTAAAGARVADFETAVAAYLRDHRSDLEQVVAALAGPGTGGMRPADESAPAAPSPAAIVAGLASAGQAVADDIQLWAGDYGLQHPTDRAGLALIAHEGSITPSELAARLRMTSGGTTLLVDRLAANGLVARHRPTGAADRRSVEITLTERGEVAAARLRGSLADHAQPLVEAFSLAAAAPARDSSVAAG